MNIVVVLYILAQIIASTYMGKQLANSIEAFYNHLWYTLATIIFYILTSYKKPGRIDYLLQQESSQFQINDELQTSDKNRQESKKLIINRRCQICQINQLIRMKHCRQCNICVPTFDHHCPWISNCVGQKNKHIFYVFLWIHFGQVCHAMIAMIETMYERGSWQSQQISFLSFVGIIICGLAGLIITQTYLMVTNLTTWQILSWDKISYLKPFKMKKQSPFSISIFNNIVSFWYYGFINQNNKWIFNAQSRQILKNFDLEFK